MKLYYVTRQNTTLVEALIEAETDILAAKLQALYGLTNHVLHTAGPKVYAILHKTKKFGYVNRTAIGRLTLREQEPVSAIMTEKPFIPSKDKLTVEQRRLARLLKVVVKAESARSRIGHKYVLEA